MQRLSIRKVSLPWQKNCFPDRLGSRDQLQTKRRSAEERQLNDRAEETEKDDLTFVVTNTLKTFGDTFLPLENSF